MEKLECRQLIKLVAKVPISAVVYIMKFSDLLPGKIGFHGIFHIFIMLCGVVHYLMFYLGVTRALISNN